MHAKGNIDQRYYFVIWNCLRFCVVALLSSRSNNKKCQSGHMQSMNSFEVMTLSDAEESEILRGN